MSGVVLLVLIAMVAPRLWPVGHEKNEYLPENEIPDAASSADDLLQPESASIAEQVPVIIATPSEIMAPQPEPEFPNKEKLRNLTYMRTSMTAFTPDFALASRSDPAPVFAMASMPIGGSFKVPATPAKAWAQTPWSARLQISH